MNETTTPFKTCSLQLVSIPLTLVMGTGANVSIQQESLYKKYLYMYHLRNTDKNLLSFDNNEISVQGIVDLSVTHETTHVNDFSFYVTVNGSSVRGVDLFNRLGFLIQKNGIPFQAAMSSVHSPLHLVKLILLLLSRSNQSHKVLDDCHCLLAKTSQQN